VSTAENGEQLSSTLKTQTKKCIRVNRRFLIQSRLRHY
jgi:hypothetical protein